MSEQPAPGPARVCPSCGEAAAPDARFCESCGSDLPAVHGAPVVGGASAAAGPVDAGSSAAAASGDQAVDPGTGVPAGCRECGGQVDPDGYCVVCGAKAPRPRDHLVERPQPWVGGVSDRGVRHHRNEDALALAAGPVPGERASLVVCDGVSSSEDSDVASLAAARAARDLLAVDRSVGLATDGGLTAALGARLVDATDAAADAVAASTSPDHGTSPPSCTFVAAVVHDGWAVVGVVGDSRAYWLPDAGAPEALTVDDSWAAERMAAGRPRAEAESGPHAHAITRWLGVDAPDHRPRLSSRRLDAPGWLLLCSDGLWNYASEASALGAVVGQARAQLADHDTDPVALAEALVAWANAAGGHDNITVALARIDQIDGGPGDDDEGVPR